MNKLKKIILLSVFLLSALPSWAVFNEKDLSQTLQVLRYELEKSYAEMESHQQFFVQNDEEQHERLISLIQNCNELSLMLYSQKQDFTFDLTYALQQVTDQYRNFTQSRMPYDNILSYLDVEIGRYTRLLSSLNSLSSEQAQPSDSVAPVLVDSLMQAISTQFKTKKKKEFILDDQAGSDRDSCVFYAEKLLEMYTDLRVRLVEDNEYYDISDKRLKEAYDYAQERYRMVQKKIFIDGQDNYWKVLTNLKGHLKQVSSDFNDKYLNSFHNGVKSEWRGPKVLAFSFFMLVFLAISILISNIAVKLLKRKWSLLKTEDFTKREFSILLLLSLVFFLLSIAGSKVLNPQAHFFNMASTLLVEYALLLISILISILIRSNPQQVNPGMKLYTPVMLMGLLVISFRIIFIPNSLINLTYPPILLIFAFWQRRTLRKNGDIVQKVDKNFAAASLAVTLLSMVIAVSGYCLLGLQVYIWWIFQFTVLQVILAFKHIFSEYVKTTMERKKRAYRIRHKSDVGKNDGSYILVTWFPDLIEKAIVPMLTTASFPFCIYMASKVFDLSEVCMNIFFYPFFDYEFLNLTLSKLVTAVMLVFLFRYFSYLLRSLFRIYKIRKAVSMNPGRIIRENEINLTLPNNLVGIFVWGMYAIFVIGLLGIPTASLSVITAGLAAGLGFAMKDILNNFFYGVQLMSGRLRVGDTIECDGIRGTVHGISYQTTQILGVDGSLIAFPNSILFSKSFKNLTLCDSYETLILPVGVAYGTDIENARQVILEALAPLCQSDKFGRDVVRQSTGIQVVLQSFGDSCINLAVKQHVLVEQKYNYISQANEAIYNALRNNNIEIPFPQVDLNFKNPLVQGSMPAGQNKESNINQNKRTKL